MSDLYPLRIYMADSGDFGIIHVHYKGADVIMRNLSFRQAQDIIDQAMEKYPDNSLADAFSVRTEVEQIAEVIKAQAIQTNTAVN